ncbi:MAG TPA: NAD-dependent epimerase/dehydratase family protein [Patescibacteria group bacterium]|nr:NAD-dependent epimerase/dehydratase family protein [Patescibacteria group bacterium]
MKKNKVLITGGAGFIGSSLASRLVNEGYRVTILDAMIPPYGGNMFNIADIKNKIRFVKGDVRDPKIIEELISGVDFVFHLAGQTGRNISMSDPVLDTQINSIGTLVVLSAIKKMKRKPKLIFSGSRGVIGQPIYLPVDEKHPENPRDIYGINKLAAEKYIFLFGKEYSFPVTVLRFNNVYGPRCQIRSNHYGTLNLFISYALQDKIMPIYGDGQQTRDYVYVDDVVDSLIKAIPQKGDGQMYFVGTGIGTSINKIAEIIEEKIPGSKHKFIAFPKELKSVDFPDFYSTSKKIEKELLWRPEVSVEKGIEKTIEFYKNNLKYYI